MVFWGELHGRQCGGNKDPGWLLGVSEFEVMLAETSGLGGEQGDIHFECPESPCFTWTPSCSVRFYPAENESPASLLRRNPLCSGPSVATQQLAIQSLQVHQIGEMCALDSKISRVLE